MAKEHRLYDRAERKRLDNRILVAIACGASSFAELLIALGSVYPTELLVNLQRLARQGRVEPATARRFRFEAGSPYRPPAPMQSFSGSSLPVPHPLSFDWRFTDKTVSELIETLGVGASSTRTALLGTPSIFLRMLDRGLADRTILIDEDALLVNSLCARSESGTVLRCDLLRDSLPRISVGTVMADPPWYPDEIRGFLWAARQLTSVGALIAASFPPIDTRARVLQEREAIFSWAAEVGLEVVDVQEGQLRYTAPPFEQNALRAAGVECVPPGWRSGTLVRFRAREPISNLRPTPEIEEHWVELTVRGVRLRVRLGEQTAKRVNVCDPRLINLVEGDVLPTVSRRHPIRATVRVWTSGNRVFDCSHPDALIRILAALGRGERNAPNVVAEVAATGHSVSLDQVETTIRQVDQVIEQEIAEYGDLWSD